MLSLVAKVIEVPVTAKVAAPDTDKVPVILEFQVIAAPPLETVKAPLVVSVAVMFEFPVMAAPPLETVISARDVKPVHVIDFVVSNPIPYCPALAPDKARVNIVGDTA